MTDLLIRNVPDDLMMRLKAQANANGRSTASEVRRILADALREERKAPKASERTLTSLIGAGRRENSMTTDEIVQWVRELRDEWSDR